MNQDPDNYEWRVLPGRKVAHAICSGRSFCGHSSQYTESQLTLPKSGTKRCERCVIDIVSGICAMSYKFMVSHVPADVRRKQRKAYREYRMSSVK